MRLDVGNARAGADLAQENGLRAEAEAFICAACQAGDFSRAASLALQYFGAEMRRYVGARLRSQAQAEDAYLQFCEDLWVGLPSFRWQSAVRVWMFVLARNAATRVGRAQRRELLQCTSRELPEEIERLRTSTALFMQTGAKNRLRELRLQLSEEEQTLLILRVDRMLAWRELALILGEANEDTSAAELDRAAARLRTRFIAARKRLRTLAQAEGLIPAASE